MVMVYNFTHKKTICEMSCNLCICKIVTESKCLCGGERMMSWNV